MPGTPRTEDELADLTAAAREMREDGMAMHEISHELAVPVSTLFRWAAQGRWRGKDIAAARMRAVFAPRTLSSSGRAERGPGDPGPDAEAGTTAGGMGGPVEPGHDSACEGGEDTAPPPLTPLDARAAGERAFKGAMLLMEAGELKTAGEAMRLAERMLLAARLLAGLPLPEGHDPDEEDPREELRRRIERLVALDEKKKQAEAEAANTPGYWPGDAGSDDLDARYGFTEPETEEQSGGGAAS